MKYSLIPHAFPATPKTRRFLRSIALTPCLLSLAPAAEWYEKMQIGPAWSHTFADTFEGDERLAATKGLLIELDHGKRALYDTETLSLVTAYEGGVIWGGTPWTRAHGPLVKLDNAETALFNNPSAPGWAGPDGVFGDPQEEVSYALYTHDGERREATGAFGPMRGLDFHGYFRHGNDIVLDYEVHGTRILDHVEATADGLVRHLQVAPHDRPLRARIADVGEGEFQLRGPGRLRESDGSLILTLPPSDTSIRLTLAIGTAAPEPKDLAALRGGGPGLWKGTVETEADTSERDAAWVVDTITLPAENPWHANMRFGAFDFLDADRAAVSSWNGDVWIVSGLEDMEALEWKRFAAGLFEPLGLKVIDEVIHVHGRDQISRLHDLNDDGEADHFEVFNRDVFVSPNFHEYNFNLLTDDEGFLYYAKAAPVRPGGRGFDVVLPHHGTVVKVAPDGSSSEVIATGLRAPGGMGVGPDGLITTGENEGTWQPCCKINHMPKSARPSFFGTEDTRQDLADAPYREPLMYLPMDVENSGSSQVWVPEGADWGMDAGEMIHLSYGKSSLYRVLEQQVGDVRQGAVVRIPVNLGSSAMRARFHPDGSLYVLGFRGWQTNAARECAFHRIRRGSAPVPIPDSFEITPTGVRLGFEVELDEELATDAFSYSAQRWDYVRGPQYGSGEFSVDHPDLGARERALSQESHNHRQRDQIEIGECRLLDDGMTIEVDLVGHKPSMQLKFSYDLESGDGEFLEGEVHSTVHRIPES